MWPGRELAAGEVVALGFDGSADGSGCVVAVALVDGYLAVVDVEYFDAVCPPGRLNPGGHLPAPSEEPSGAG